MKNKTTKIDYKASYSKYLNRYDGDADFERMLSSALSLTFQNFIVKIDTDERFAKKWAIPLEEKKEEVKTGTIQLTGCGTISGISYLTSDANSLKINGGNSVTIATDNFIKWELIDTIVKDTCIELVYKGNSTIFYSFPLQPKIKKMIYGVKDGKFGLIKEVEGRYIPATEESYSF